MIDRQINKSTPTNFKLIFPKFPYIDDDGEKELTLNIYETVIPSLTLETDELKWQGAKYITPSGKVTFNPWNVNFMVDSDFKNWIKLMRWITHINNNFDQFVRSPSTYSVMASMLVIDNWNNPILNVVFENVWITEIGEVRFSYREGSTDLVSQATFAYSRYMIAREVKTGKLY